MVIASNGHTFAHLPQPIQADSQFFFAAAPFSWLMQLTNTLREFLPLFLNSITERGQAFTQAPHATHFSSSTSGNLFSGLI